MKKILLISILAISSLFVNAQDTSKSSLQKKFAIHLGASYYQSSSRLERVGYLNLGVSYILNKHISFGLDYSIGDTKLDYVANPSYRMDYNLYNINYDIYGKYSFLAKEYKQCKIKPFIAADMVYAYYRLEKGSRAPLYNDPYFDNQTSEDGFINQALSLGLSIGCDIVIKDKFGFSVIFKDALIEIPLETEYETIDWERRIGLGVHFFYIL